MQQLQQQLRYLFEPLQQLSEQHSSRRNSLTSNKNSSRMKETGLVHLLKELLKICNVFLFLSYSNSFTGHKTISLLQECCDFTIKKEELLGQHQQCTVQVNNSTSSEITSVKLLLDQQNSKSIVFESWRILHCPATMGLHTIPQCTHSQSNTECWPCPLFDILLNKYFPAG